MLNGRVSTLVRLAGAMVLVALAAPACEGGPGALPGYRDAYDPHPGYREGPGSGREVPPTGERPSASNEKPPQEGVQTAPGAQVGGPDGGQSSGGAFVCSGRWDCVTANDTDRITLVLVDGKCVVEGLVLESNGTLSAEGQTVGSWSASGTTLTLTGPEGSATCTRRESTDDRGSSGG